MTKHILQLRNFRTNEKFPEVRNWESCGREVFVMTGNTKDPHDVGTV